jgi:hypothetical protein
MYEDGQKPGDIISQEQVYKEYKSLNLIQNGFALFLVSKEMSIFPNCNAKWYENACWCWLGNDLELNERELKV